MKRLVLVVVLVGLLSTVLAGVALAAPPTQMGPGNGIHTPGTGLMQPGTGMGAGNGAGMRRGAPAWAGGPDDVAAILGMKAEEIQALRLKGQSLVDIAQTKGVDEKTLVEKLLAARKVDLDKLVGEQKLTQEQADYMLSHMQTQVSTMVERTTTGPAWQGAQAGQGTNAQQGTRMGRGGMGRWNQ
jgi:hypothetical protein